MKVIAFLLFIFLLVALQGTLLENISLKGIKPDLLFILSYGIGLYKGEMNGLFWGGFVGLMMDSSTGILLGPNLTSKATVGFLSGYFKRKVFRMTVTVSLIFLFILSILDGIMNFISINIFIGTTPFFKSFLSIILPQALYNTLFGVIIWALFERFKIRDVREPARE
jgi:rod shape-determining protein MreD